MKSKMIGILFTLCLALTVAVVANAQTITAVNILTNSYFDQGAQGWNMTSTHFNPPVGTIGANNFAYIGSIDNETTNIEQTVIFDTWSSSTDLDLEFKYRIYSSELACHYDTVEVGVWESYWFGPDTYHVLQDFQLCAATQTNNNWHTASYDLSAYSHADAITIVFKGVTDGSNISVFDIDDVYLWEGITISTLP